MSETTEPHPLDDLDAAPSRKSIPYPANAHLPLLKPCAFVAMACVVMIFMAGVATLIAAPNSTLETVGSFLYRASTWVLLLACCGMLISFRYLQIRDFVVSGEKSPMDCPYRNVDSGGSESTKRFDYLVYLLACDSFKCWGTAGGFFGNDLDSHFDHHGVLQ